MLPSQPNESLIDGLTCLQALTVCKEPVGVRELARRLDLEPTRVHRLLKTLAHLGIASQTPSRKYTTGPGMHVLAAQSIFASGLIRKSLPYLASLQKHGFLVAHGVLWKDKVSYFYHAEPGMPLEQALGRLGLYDATCSSIGMILMAENSDKEIGRIYKSKDIPGYPEGISELLVKIREIRKCGYAKIVTGNGMTSLAVTVGNPPHSALALSGKMEPRDVQKYFKILKDTAIKI
ncbi:MAG: helix-turn-helix domain-containing protein [Victivallales bacterium]